MVKLLYSADLNVAQTPVQANGSHQILQTTISYVLRQELFPEDSPSQTAEAPQTSSTALSQSHPTQRHETEPAHSNK